ncbi:uncharacterized protein LOC131801720 [Musca domestica]|uniref:Uncharacterized protein LOC101896584 n=1 Tax=Musca domestica TaxID=7370 RepID=A0A1I8ND43_MUSDO|nr:uncharacterized protein LOC101896584 [Musca domestica]XP_058976641.1 uncharacterized protein LOC131801720 [Musca domestica]
MCCCTVRCWSLFLAWSNLIGCVIGFILTVALIFVGANSEMQDERQGMFILNILIPCIVCIINIVLYVLLLVGIYQKRHRLMAVFVYTTIVGIVLGVIVLIGVFIFLLIILKHEFVYSIVVLVVGLICIGIEILAFSPIYILYKRIRKANSVPEQYGLSTNQPLYKTDYN